MASSDIWLQLIYQSLVLTNIQTIIAQIKCIRLSFFIARVVGYLPSSTQNNIVASDYLLAWLLKKFKTNLLIVGLRIHSPLGDVVMDSCISWRICSHALDCLQTHCDPSYIAGLSPLKNVTPFWAVSISTDNTFQTCRCWWLLKGCFRIMLMASVSCTHLCRLILLFKWKVLLSVLKMDIWHLSCRLGQVV